MRLFTWAMDLGEETFSYKYIRTLLAAASLLFLKSVTAKITSDSLFYIYFL